MINTGTISALLALILYVAGLSLPHLLMITVDDQIHSTAKDYPTYAQIVVQISSWFTGPPHN